MMHDKYHALTVSMAVLESKEGKERDILRHMQPDYSESDIAYCLDQCPEYTVRDINDANQILTY